MKILLAPTLDLAKQAKSEFNPEITIEAEYGDEVIEGSVYTAAHHGSRKNNVAPCVDPMLLELGASAHGSTTFLVSHVDLDTLLAIYNYKHASPDENDIDWPFCKAAALMDEIGYHHISKVSQFEHSNISENSIKRELFAYQAWSLKNKLEVPRDKVSDITTYVESALSVLYLICCYHNDDYRKLLQDGLTFEEQQKRFDEETFIEQHGRLIVRVSPVFANTFYRENGDIIACFNTKYKTVTLSTAQEIPGFNCIERMQAVFGKEAGGRPGIAGSPRGMVVTLNQFSGLVDDLENFLNRQPIQECFSCGVVTQHKGDNCISCKQPL